MNRNNVKDVAIGAVAGLALILSGVNLAGDRSPVPAAEPTEMLSAMDVAGRPSEEVRYRDFEFSQVELVFLAGDCVVDEEPGADHPVVYFCVEENDYLGKLAEELLEELKRLESEAQEEGRMMWFYFP